MLPATARVVIVDNYDSFTYNLVQAFGALGAEVQVFRNDAISVVGIRRLAPTHVVLSPGPSRPERAGVTLAVVHELGGELPILGVCLGHQAIGACLGGRVIRAQRPMHGKTSSIEHDARGVFARCPNPLVATRYHSLVVEEATLPACLEVSARSLDDGEVMGLRYVGADRLAPLEGVQFHPESFLTRHGSLLLAAFLEASGSYHGIP